MVRKYLSILICMALLFSLITPDLVQANDDRPKEDPKIVIAKDHWMPVYNAGETVNLSIPVENLTNTAAINVRVSISPAGDTFPFEMDKMSFTKYAYSLTGRSVFSYKVTIPANTKPGVYPINVSVTYETDYGTGGGVENATVYVKIENNYKQPKLKLLGVDFEGERLPSGKSSLIKLKIQNDGDLDLKDIELKLNGFSTQGISLDNWPDTQYVKSMKAREIKLVEYRLFLDSKMESGTYPLDLSIKYKDEYDKEYTKDTKVYLPVDGKGGDDLTPRIIVDNYYIPSEYVEAGEVFPLTISFFNTSETITAKNIKISLNSDGQVFSPVGSSNSFYVNEINPREFIERTIILKPKVDAENQNHTISVDIDFQDSKGNKYNDKDIISIPVNQKVKLTISNIEKSPQAFVGSPTSLSVDFYNTGRTLIRNLLIKTEGNFEIQDGTFFVGNLEPGADNYYDVTIIPQEAGKLEGKIIFQYEDAIGDTYLLEEPFTLEVMEQEMPPMFDRVMENMPPDVQPSFLAKFKIPLIILGVLLVIGIGTFIFIRRKKKMQEEVFLDE